MATTARPAAEGTEVQPGDILVEVKHLTMDYVVKGGRVSAVSDVSFTLKRGGSLGLVGESGCGKTSAALTLLRLQADNAEITHGEVLLGGLDLLKLSEDEMRRHRWNDVAMVFQGAMNAWNPVYRIGDQIREALDLHWPVKLNRQEVRERITELFALVGLPPEDMDRYPHEFSGGMRQRATIAMALSCNPQLIIADEPTTALDVIVQDQILKELKTIQAELGMSIIYISHDIAVIAQVTEQTGVMYAGKLMEYGGTGDIFATPAAPLRLAAALLDAVDHRAAAQVGAAGGGAARSDTSTHGLPVPPPLPVRHREVHRPGASHGGRGHGASGGLLAP